MKTWRRVFYVTGALIALAAGCGNDSGAANGGTSGSGTGGGGGGITGAGGSGTTGAGGLAGGSWTGGSGGNGTLGCSPSGPKCNNCMDDDGDGKIDAADPECIGPLDNDEATFATGIPGDNMDPCRQDCFFDGNSGAGDDGCEWNLKCDMASPGANLPKACPYDANYNNCPTTQSQMCLTTCRTVTPNGCDCFGCCLPPGAANPILLAPTCTAADFNDPAKCPRCTQVAACSNPCERCEICVGKPTLPADCNVTGAGGAGGTTGTGGTGGSPGGCSAGQAYCGPGGVASCPAGSFCITGCCIPNIIG